MRLFIFLLIPFYGLAAFADPRLHTVVFSFDAASGHVTKINSLSPDLYSQRVHLTIDWYSPDGLLPELTLCNLTITPELLAEMDVTPSARSNGYVGVPERSGCYHLTPVNRHGRLSFDNVLLPETVPKTLVRHTPNETDWRLAFEIEKKPSAIALHLSAGFLSREFRNTFNESDEIPFGFSGVSGRSPHGLTVSGGWPGQQPFYPPGRPGFDIPDSQEYHMELISPAQIPEDHKTQNQPRHLIQIHTSDQQSFNVWLTHQDWLLLLAENQLSARSIMAFLKQRLNQQQLQLDQRQALEDLLERQSQGDTRSVDDDYIRYLLEELSTPVSVEIMSVSHSHFPEILTFGNTPSKSASRSFSKSGSGQTSSPCGASLTAGDEEELPDESEDESDDDRNQPPNNPGAANTAELSEQLDLVAVLLSEPSLELHLGREFLMLLYAFNCLSFSELSSEYYQKRPFKDVLPIYLSRLQGLQDKLRFLKIILTELSEDKVYQYTFDRLLQAVPVVFHERLSKPLTIEIRPPQDSEQALETLLQFLGGTLFYYRTYYEIKETLRCGDALASLSHCRTAGITAFRELYKNDRLRRFFDTHLPWDFARYLQGADAIWPDPELPEINQLTDFFQLPGVERLNFWLDLTLRAYGKSAITWHHFQLLAQAPDVQRSSLMKEIVSLLDNRRADRLFSTMLELLKTQNPKLWEEVNRQANGTLKELMGVQPDSLPMPEDAGESDDWRRAMAAALDKVNNRDQLGNISHLLFSRFVLEEPSWGERSRPLSESKASMLLEAQVPDRSRGDVHQLVSGAFEKIPEACKAFETTLREIRYTYPRFVKSKRLKLDGDRDNHQKEESEEASCPVCLDSMCSKPTVICSACQNGVCIDCGKKIRAQLNSHCPYCREQALIVPRCFLDENKR